MECNFSYLMTISVYQPTIRRSLELQVEDDINNKYREAMALKRN